MKKAFIAILLFAPCALYAQLGLKAGYNYANITNASQVGAESKSGFHLGAFLSPTSKGLFSSRTELIFSRQGYNYETSTNTGTVDLDYIILPQLMGINITKFVQVQAGFQVAYLLNAKADSTATSSSNTGTAKMMDMYNRFDYGFSAGLELNPFKGMLLGARANFGLGKLYKQQPAGPMPSFIPEVKTRNNVIQVFAGWRFGK